MSRSVAGDGAATLSPRDGILSAVLDDHVERRILSKLEAGADIREVIEEILCLCEAARRRLGQEDRTRSRSD